MSIVPAGPADSDSDSPWNGDSESESESPWNGDSESESESPWNAAAESRQTGRTCSRSNRLRAATA